MNPLHLPYTVSYVLTRYLSPVDAACLAACDLRWEIRLASHYTNVNLYEHIIITPPQFYEPISIFQYASQLVDPALNVESCVKRGVDDCEKIKNRLMCFLRFFRKYRKDFPTRNFYIVNGMYELNSFFYKVIASYLHVNIENFVCNNRLMASAIKMIPLSFEARLLMSELNFYHYNFCKIYPYLKSGMFDYADFGYQQTFVRLDKGFEHACVPRSNDNNRPLFAINIDASFSYLEAYMRLWSSQWIRSNVDLDGRRAGLDEEDKCCHCAHNEKVKFLYYMFCCLAN